VAKISVRYLNGDEDEWELHDAMDLDRLVQVLTRASATSTVSFGVPAPAGGSTDFDFVGIRVGQITSWRVHGFFDLGSAAALWHELERDGEGD
jgi:hypothetical protein